MRILPLATLATVLLSTTAFAGTSVISSITPVQSLVDGVMGDVGRSTLLVPGNASPHTYTLKPSQRGELERATIIFYIGAGYENFLTKPLEQVPATVQKVALADAPGVTVLETREGGNWEPHDHSEEAHDHHHHHHDHAHDKHHRDMHIWLSPQNGIAMTAEIARILGAVDPANKDVYAANAKKVVAGIKTADAQLEQQMAPLKDKTFIVFHDAYQYFERHYNLSAVGSVTLVPGQPVSAKRVLEITKRISATGATCVFREPQFPGDLVQTVIQGTVAREGILDPLGSNIAPGVGLYPALLLQVGQQLQDCLLPK